MSNLSNHNVFIHILPKVKVVECREQFMLSCCKGKNVLDVGCVRSGVTENFFYKGELLHLKIREVAIKVVGIDIDKEGIDFLAKQGVSDLICWDVQEIDKLKLDIPVDVIVAGEILEHLENPGLFLKSVSDFMDKDRGVLVISVPNAFSLRSFFSVLVKKRELVRSDHNCYFSYITIRNLLRHYNLNIIDTYAYSEISKELSPFKKFIKKFFNYTVFKLSPFSAEGLIIVASKTHDANA